jgi:hypothetical protein
MSISYEQVLKVLNSKLLPQELRKDDKNQTQTEAEWNNIVNLVDINKMKIQEIINELLEPYKKFIKVASNLSDPEKKIIEVSLKNMYVFNINEKTDSQLNDLLRKLNNIYMSKNKIEFDFIGNAANLIYKASSDNYTKANNAVATLFINAQVETPKINQPEVVKAVETEVVKEVATTNTSGWQNKPVPDGPDKHEEFDCRSLDAFDNMKIIGARARGKKHKHEGTNCDDWFEFKSIGPWTVIAVADGAGSRKFSRVGAKAACITAVKYMSEKLSDFSLLERETWTNDIFKYNDANMFIEKDVQMIQDILHESMEEAYSSVKKAYAERANNIIYKEIMGRELVVEDFSSTLLVAIHIVVGNEGSKKSIVVTCQIGDGISAVIDYNGCVRIMGVPDSGEYSGETDFLPSLPKIKRNGLKEKTRYLLGEIRALMVMTDGVADDYFPNETEMLKLYGDLIVNDVIGIKDIGEEESLEAIRTTKVGNISNWLNCEFHNPPGLVSINDGKIIYIRSFEEFSKEIEVPMEELVKSYPLLVAGKLGKRMCEAEEYEKKLQIWLDSYHVRGSFDDRTLVVLYKEEIL